MSPLRHDRRLGIKRLFSAKERPITDGKLIIYCRFVKFWKKLSGNTSDALLLFNQQRRQGYGFCLLDL